MPFNLFGDYIPEDETSKTAGPVKLFLEKRKGSTVTIIKNLPLTPPKKKELLSSIKKTLGCGGSIKNGQVEIQGDKTKQAKDILKKEKLL